MKLSIFRPAVKTASENIPLTFSKLGTNELHLQHHNMHQLSNALGNFFFMMGMKSMWFGGKIQNPTSFRDFSKMTYFNR